MTTPLDGWKTYIVMAAGTGAVLLFYFRGDITGIEALPMILGFLGLGAVRHGIARNGR